MTERVRSAGVLNTVSLAWRIGRCIALAEATNSMSSVGEQIVEVAGGSKSARVLFRTPLVQRLFILSSIAIAGEEGKEEIDSPYACGKSWQDSEDPVQEREYLRQTYIGLGRERAYHGCAGPHCSAGLLFLV